MSTVPEVVLGAEASGLLVLRDPRRGGDGEIWSVTAVIETAGLRAETLVATHYATHFDEVIGFIVDLADCWRGWMGSKTYSSLERDLRLDAVHDGAHVRLGVTLSGPAHPPQWTVTTEITTDPGAQMEGAASDARSLLVARL